MAQRPYAQRYDGSLGLCIQHADQYPFGNLNEILQHHGPVIERINTSNVQPQLSRGRNVAFGYGRPLGEALRDSPDLQVVRLDLSMWTFFRREQHYNLDDALPMLDYVRTSKSLRSLCLERALDAWLGWPLVVQLLQAAAENPNLKSLTTKEIALPAGSITHFVTTTASLEALELDFFALHKTSGNPVEIKSLEDAFAANRSIKRLSFAYGRTHTEADVYEPIMQRLDSRNGTSDLNVRVAICIQQRHLIDTMLQCHNVLDKLRLYRGELLEEDIDMLSENHSLTELALSEVTIKLPVARKLINFINKDANRNGNSLCSLVIDRCTFTLDAAARSDFPDILLGSALQSLWLEEPYDAPNGYLVTHDFFAALAANASKIQARRLEFQSIEYHSSIAVFLAKTGRVEELKAHFGPELNSSDVVQDLRANGSLRSVNFSIVYPTASIFSDEQQRRVDLYLERNIKLPAMFNPPSIVAGTSALANKRDGATSSDVDYMRLFPTLFAVAKDGRGTAANNILKGLKSIAETFSSTRRPKDRARARSSVETSNGDIDQEQH